MLVKNWMTQDIATVRSDDSLSTAVNLLRLHDIHILPVVNHNTVLGIISASDINQESNIFLPLSSAPEKTVAEFMVRDFITVFFNHTVEETAEILMKNNISSVPVIDHDQKLVGIITRKDLLRAFVIVTGADRRGILFAFIINDQRGSIRNLTDTIHNNNARIASVFTTHENAPKGCLLVYIRMFGIDRFKLRILTEELKGKASMVYMIDRPEVRKEYTQKQTV